MKIVTASKKLTGRFFSLLVGKEYAAFMRALERKYPHFVSFSYDMPSSESDAFMSGLKAAEKSKTWLYIVSSEEHLEGGYFFPTSEHDFALWLIDNFLSEDE